MPELPEVETIVNGLRSKIVGKEIAQLDVLLSKTVWLDTIQATGDREVGQVSALVQGKKVDSITRRGKMIIVNLSSDVVVLIHLKMTGQLIYVDSKNNRYAGGHPTSDMSKEMPVKSTRAIFKFSDNSHLYFNDQRQFGYIKILTPTQFTSYLESLSYGPEALSDQFNARYLFDVAQKRPKITIKQLLLDQRVVAGIGNIYADEGLFAARIHPACVANRLSISQINILVEHVKQVLTFSIEHNGTSSEHYVTANGFKGDMQNYLRVYRKDGEPCPNCGREIERMVIGGRGTHYCSNCQVRV